jgi:XRE family transcriptional regulator, regulator of sulfur utilization
MATRSRRESKGKSEGSPTARRTPVPPGDEIGAADLARRVAESLRAQRKKRDLSLDQLAGLTGVSRAALSQIETRKTNPTIGVLWKIASGLGIPFSDLIGDSQLPISVLRREETQVLRSLDRKFESRPLMPPAGVSQIEMYELTLLARARHTSESHGPGTRELVVVLSGTLKMTVGDSVDELAAGDSVVFDANLPHVYENPGASEARYHDIIIYQR